MVFILKFRNGCSSDALDFSLQLKLRPRRSCCYTLYPMQQRQLESFIYTYIISDTWDCKVLSIFYSKSCQLPKRCLMHEF